MNSRTGISVRVNLITETNIPLYAPILIYMRENTDQKKLLIWTLYTQYSFCIKPKPDKSDKPD